MFDYNSYWEKCWIEDDSDELYGFLKGYYKLNSKEIELFKESGVHTVCDAACGFGAYSLALASNGFDTYSFDLSFDIPEDDDMTAPHFCPEEGTMQYTGEGREGMLFHPYDWDSVNNLLSGSEIIYKADKGTRERVVIIRK